MCVDISVIEFCENATTVVILLIEYMGVFTIDTYNIYLYVLTTVTILCKM